MDVSATAANLPSDWQREQSFDVSTAGLVKISLPVETLDAARPALEDLRLYDDTGHEIPYLIERPVPVPKIIRTAKSFRVSLNPDNTVITLETGLSEPIDARHARNSSQSISSKPSASKVPTTAIAGKFSRKASRFFASPTAQATCKFRFRRVFQNGCG